MTTAADLTRALATAGLEAPVRWDEVTGSTNATAWELAAGGSPEWTLVAAGHQTDGRGRLGRSWSDEAGRALMFSVVLRPELPPERVGLLPLLAGAALAEAASTLTGRPIRCKWPNDVLAPEGKVAGILMEASQEEGVLRHVVMGVGVNLDAPDVERAAGLGDVDPVGLLGAFLRGFHEGYPPRDAAEEQRIVRRWSAVSDTIGRDVEVTRADGSVERGRATGVDDLGGLIVDTSGGPTTVRSGEVAHLR
jgi:BirA family transcriptional regulator, biotin operon repressor / biotin---[acetyl-CoA-carboxylase] ligase